MTPAGGINLTDEIKREAPGPFRLVQGASADARDSGIPRLSGIDS